MGQFLSLIDLQETTWQAQLVSKFDVKTIEKYQSYLKNDPKSLVFAPLAEAYFERGLVAEAEKLIQIGVQRHPQYVGGFVVWGKILMGKEEFSEAVKVLRRATELSPENVLAYQLLGQCFFELKQTKEAINAHKMVLFLNPLNEKSRRFVEKLETLTADEYEPDLFEIRPPTLASPSTEATTTTRQHQMDRTISLVDALIVRNDLDRAQALLIEADIQNPGNEEIAKRMSLLGLQAEHAQDLNPLPKRENQILESKIRSLQNILSALRNRQHSMG